MLNFLPAARLAFAAINDAVAAAVAAASRGANTAQSRGAILSAILILLSLFLLVGYIRAPPAAEAPASFHQAALIHLVACRHGNADAFLV
jgi:hypothetical protein